MLVSVIIPTRNRVEKLLRAIDSAKRAGSNVEVVVIDDASTDDTERVCRGTSDIRYLRMDRNVGPSAARNAGIRNSAGELIAFLDDDDQRIPGSLDKQAPILAQNEHLGLVYGRVSFADTESGEKIGREMPEVCPTGDIFWRLVAGNFIYTPAVLTRRRDLEYVGLFERNLRRAEDWDLWLRLAAVSEVEAVQDPIAVVGARRRRSGGLSSNRPKMCRALARVQARALRSPRGLTVQRHVRQQIRSAYLDELWTTLAIEGENSLEEGRFYHAAFNFIAATWLRPGRACRPGAVANLMRSLIASSKPS